MRIYLNILIGCLCYIGLSCNSQNPTPDGYKYSNSVSKAQYQKYLAELDDSIETLIKGRQGPFYPDQNDSSTKIFIDTILFSPKNDKYATFVITKNRNSKLPERESDTGTHYNAYCFIGMLHSDSSIQDLSWISAHILVRYKTLSEASFRIREVYFKELTSRKDFNNEGIFKYNFDDIRFWNGPIWQKYYQ